MPATISELMAKTHPRTLHQRAEALQRPRVLRQQQRRECCHECDECDACDACDECDECDACDECEWNECDVRDDCDECLTVMSV